MGRKCHLLNLIMMSLQSWVDSKLLLFFLNILFSDTVSAFFFLFIGHYGIKSWLFVLEQYLCHK